MPKSCQARLNRTPGDGQVKVRESDYLDRAFEEKAHGQTPQLFDRVRAPGGAGVYRCTVSCCASMSVTRKPVRIIPEVTSLAFNRHHRIMDRLGSAVLPYRHWELICAQPYPAASMVYLT